MLQGLMMRMPLLISSLIRHADRHHGDVEIVSRRVEGDMHRCTYRELHRRSRQLANALEGLGIRSSDRVATLAWNTHRHMELYFAVSGIGAVLHTVNPRLFQDQIAYIVDHGGCNVLLPQLFAETSGTEGNGRAPVKLGTAVAARGGVIRDVARHGVAASARAKL